MMRKFIIVLALGLVLWPTVSFAGLDQRCWERKACEAARVRIIGAGSEAKDGFVSKLEDSSVAAACPNDIIDDAGNASGKDVGFCLPAGQSETRISFGGTNKFLNMGEFIKFIYRYSMWAATIIAVMLIIISGIQWTASGGNADMIGSAKKRIAGAISGLILLAFAYTILNTINPFLVNLRLPQSWLINEQGMAPSYCLQLKGAKKLAYYKKSDEVIDQKNEKKLIDSSRPTISSNIEEIKDRKDVHNYPACGYDYFVGGSGGLSCQGTLCETNQTCAPIMIGENKKGAKDLISSTACFKGGLIIHLSLDNIFQNIGANLDSFLVNEFLHTQANPPDWLDQGLGPGTNANLYFGCEGQNGVFPINFDSWSSDPLWFLTWRRLDPEDNNSLKGQSFSHYFLYFNPNNDKFGTTQLDSLNDLICPDKKKPTSVWVRIEIDIKNDSQDAYLFIGENADGTAVLGNWNDVAEHPIIMSEVEKTGVFLNGVVTESVIDHTFGNNKKLLPVSYVKPYTGPNPVTGPCFPAGTKIATLTGEKNIEDVNKYDSILSYDINDNSYHTGRVGNVVTHISNGYYVINDGILSVTGGHPIYAKKDNGYVGWTAIKPEEVPESSKVNALQLETGDYFFTKDNTWIKIEKINFIAQQIKVYNLKAVSPYNTFFANDILVHNKI